MPPLHARVGARHFQSHDWSEGNLLLDSEGGFGIGALITIDVIGLAKKSLATVEIRGRVERVTETGAAAVNFLHRDDRAAIELRALVDGL